MEQLTPDEEAAARAALAEAGVAVPEGELPAHYVRSVFGDGRAAPAPVQVDFELTFRCNMYCAMCPQVAYRERELAGGQIRSSPVDGDRRELTTAEVTRALDQLAAAGTEQVLFSGGEAFLRPDAMDILAHARGRGLAVHVITNGSMITEPLARRLVEVGVDGMTFSLDGPEERHDAIRKLPGGFRKLCRAVRSIRQARAAAGGERPRMALSAVIHALNQDVLAELVDVAHDLGLTHVNYNYLFYYTAEQAQATRAILHGQGLAMGVKPEDQALPLALRQVDAAALEREIAEVRRRAAARGVDVTFAPDLDADEVRRRFADPAHSVVHRCFYAYQAMRIDAWGNVYPCSVDARLGNIRQHDVLAVWNGAPYRAFRRAVKERGLFPQCPKCCVLTDRGWDRLPRATVRPPLGLGPLLER
jgi:MoaA/NifB/PqqE/SkfB family radical SAM enzyme